MFVKIAGLQPDQQMELFRILAAVLHLGNVNIQASGRSGVERSSIDVRNVFLILRLLSDGALWFFYKHSFFSLLLPLSASPITGVPKSFVFFLRQTTALWLSSPSC